MSMLDDIMNNLQWPEGGEELFRQDVDGTEAYLHHMNSFGLHATCYKEAADVLVAVSVDDRIKRDKFIYPIVFLYRHYLELSLKEISQYARRLTDQTLGMRDYNHQLDKLWDECVPLILQVWPDTDQTELKVVESCIAEFMRLDPASFAFRYPMAKDGSPLLPPDLRYINLKNLYEVMQKLANYLDGTCSGIMEAADNFPDGP